MIIRTLPRPLVTSVAALLTASSAHAAVYIWTGPNPGTTSAPLSGLWDTSTANIWTTTSGAGNLPWAQTNATTPLHSSVFAAADDLGTFSITLGTGIATSGLTFNNSGYTISAVSPQTLTDTGNITVAAGKSASIGANVTVTRNVAGSAWSIDGGGTLNINAGATVHRTNTHNLLVTGNGTTVNVAGTLSRIGNGTGSNSIRVGAVTGDNATVNVLSGGLFTQNSTNNRIEVGFGGTGTVNVQGGTMSVVNGGGFLLGVSAGSSGTVNITNGGTMTTAGDLVVGNGAAGTLNVSSGTVSATGTSTSRIHVGANNSSVGIVNISGTAMVTTGPTTGTGGINFGNVGQTSYSGTINLGDGSVGGTLTTHNIVDLGSGSSGTSIFNFNGGTLRAKANNTTFMQGLDTASVLDGGAFIDTDTFNITIGQALQTGGTNIGGLTKSGSGSLTLTGANLYQGPTVISAGSLVVNGSLASNSAVSIANGSTLGGIGTIGGAVSTISGSILSPATATTGGTLNLGSLSLSSGAIANLEFLGATNDLINVSDVGGLTLNGGTLNLFASGGSAPLATNGTYTLFNYNTNFSGLLSSLTIGNQVVGKSYAFNNNTATTTIEVTIADSALRWNGLAGDHLWTSAGNWVSTVPNAAGAVASFDSIPSTPSSVTVNGAKTVGGLVFDNANGYTVTGGATDTITLDNGTSTAGVNVNNGTHSVSAPIVLASDASVLAAATTALTLSGNISGVKGLAVAGAGTTVLTGTNSYTTTNIGAGATLNVGSGGATGTLGSGDVTVAGTLVLARSNDMTVSNNLVGSGTVRMAGTGITTITGTNTIAAIGIDQGTLKVGSATTIPSTATVSLAGGTLDLNATSVTSSTLSGTGGTITDSSAVAGVTTYTANQAANSTFGGAITDGPTRTLAFTKSGNGVLTIIGDNTYTGGTNINGTNGILRLGASERLADAGVVTIGGSAKLELNGFNETIGGLASAAGATAALVQNLETNPTSNSVLAINSSADHVFDGIIRNKNSTPGTVSLGLVKMGPGTQTVTNTSGIGSTNFTGGTTIADGKLLLRDNGNGRTIGSWLSDVTNNAALELDNTLAGNNQTFGRGIAGTGTVTKSGIGNVTLSQTNAYTGATTVNAGSLLVTGSISASIGTTVNSGATIGGTGTLGSLSVLPGGAFAPGTTGTGIITTAALTLETGSFSLFQLTFGDTSLGANDHAIATELTLDGTLMITELGGALRDNDTYVLFDYSGSLSNNGLEIDPGFLALHNAASIQIDTENTRVLLVVPEPGTALSLLGGLGVLLGLRRRRTGIA